MLLDQSLLSDLLTQSGPSEFSIVHLDTCDSTNSELAKRAQQGSPSKTVLVTDQQQAGRGRLNRTWHASPQHSLSFSVLWRPNDKTCSTGTQQARPFTGLSLIVGLAVLEALEQLGAQNIQLKWPNDLLLPTPDQELAKLAGILIELQNSKHGTAAIIGIGLNLSYATLTQIEGNKIASLCQALPPSSPLPPRHKILATLLQQLETQLNKLESQGFAASIDAWQARHCWQNKIVQLFEQKQCIAEGRCLGIDDEGALLLENAGEIKRFMAGDLSLRKSAL